MIIVLKPGSTPADIKGVEEGVKRVGGTPVLIEGKERCVIAVVGAAKVDPRQLELMESVSQVLRVSKPYKLASREVKSEDTLVHVGDLTIGGEQTIVMAGPCSVENRKMLLESAQKLSALGVTILRGGAQSFL